ncbi:stress responsive alpha/beta barrel protein [Salegentibacter sp. 24]|nr:stress responsive alpha/beta barrel protein [Salegentibacter sp. 24]
MKRILNARTILVLLTLNLIFSGCQNSNEKQMRHIVIFKYKSTATPDQIEKVTSAISNLQNKIPGIVAFEHGINDSPENKNNGFTHVYQFTFEDADARDTYLPHPEHQKFGEFLGEMKIVEDVFVVDYIPITK